MSGLSDTPSSSPSGATARSPQARRRVWWTAWTVAVALAVAMLVLLLWPGTTWWVEHVDGVRLHGEGGLAGKDRQDVLDKARGRITAVATGILAAVAIYYTANNARSARQTAKAAQESVQAALRSVEHNEAAQRRAHELTERGQLTDRFTAAVAQLGDANPAIQLGGVHALAGIADDAPRTLRQTCIDVLCAYLRLPYDPDPGPLDEEQQSNLTAEQHEAHQQRRAAYRGQREVRHTIIRLIGNHLRLDADDPRCWQGHDFDFTDAIFDGGDLHGAIFSGGQVSFSGARFSGGLVNFGEAVFSGSEVNFRYAVFTGSEVNLSATEFCGGRVNFSGAVVSGGRVYFVGAAFSEGWVRFVGTEFSGGLASFEGARFSGGEVSFMSARFCGGEVSFGGAGFCGGAVEFEHARGTMPAGLLGDAGSPPPGVRLPAVWLASEG